MQAHAPIRRCEPLASTRIGDGLPASRVVELNVDSTCAKFTKAHPLEPAAADLYQLDVLDPELPLDVIAEEPGPEDHSWNLND